MGGTCEPHLYFDVTLRVLSQLPGSGRRSDDGCSSHYHENNMRKIIRIQVDGQVQWQVCKTDTGHWVAMCEPFGLTMEGESLDELYDNIGESVQLLFEDLLDDGELDSFLKARGWTAQPLEVEKDGGVEFAVPFELLVQSGRDSAHTIN